MDEKFNLSTLDADTVMDQFPFDNGTPSSTAYNLFPNLPIVAMMVKPWIIQSNKMWIVTDHIPESIYKNLFKKNLVPIHNFGYTYPIFENSYYNHKVYNYV